MEKREKRKSGVTWNVAGLKKKERDFWEYIGGFDIIGLTETWVEENEWENLKERMPEGWRWRQQSASRDCKKGRAKGGIITGVRTELEEKENVCKEEQGMQERVVSLDGETWRMVTVYNREGKKELLEKIKEEIKEEEEERLMIVGDFNARIGRKGGWEEGEEDGNERREERYSKDEVVNSQGKELIEVIEERGWIVLNGTKEGDEEGEWTYEKASGRSVIDYGIVNWEAWQRVKRFEVGCRVESDHQPIIFELENYVERREENKKEEGTVQDWSEEGIKEFKKRIEGAVWKEERVIKEWEELEGELNKAVKVRRKGKRREIGWCPWWDKECREKKIETNRARRRYRRKREQGDEEFIRCRKEYRDLCKKKEEVYRKKEKREVENIKTEAEAWKFINKGRKKREGICKEIEIGKWEKHFREIFGGVEEKRQLWQRNKEVHREKGEGIGQEEVNREIGRSKKGKAAGLDGIRNEAWIEGGEKVRKKLWEVIKRVWDGEGFPIKWRVGVVVPIWKRGDKKETGNYRGVTLTSTGYKVYANILNKRLVKELEEKGGLV
ncbi:PREDICTED: golgin subfamily A member 6-like protein 6 [Cyphomyrmex costatus]|uniref:golgin subfamily A member 6-like protein 6 n=1 Tax=Cyphomyrmex costatus TaxID=456900 RepID=UPI00085220C4|nr:PREDICTED: golgin subfamily A member 6-like protein 6 [Cyphomyrmex costatus]